MKTYLPKPEHKFTFGLWTVGICGAGTPYFTPAMGVQIPCGSDVQSGRQLLKTS
jgi:hypothetical protein